MDAAGQLPGALDRLAAKRYPWTIAGVLVLVECADEQVVLAVRLVSVELARLNEFVPPPGENVNGDVAVDGRREDGQLPAERVVFKAPRVFRERPESLVEDTLCERPAE